MSYKIYLIKHLDTDMKYVGITSQTMEKRFMQHGSDRMGALYKIMRTDKSRMRMELIEEVFDKMEALKKEQEYIRIFDTAQPNGWNRQVTDWEYGPALTFNRVFSNAPKKWRRQNGVAEFTEGSVLVCPRCSYQYTHQEKMEIYEHEFHVIVNTRNVAIDNNVTECPATRSGQALRYFIKCESCHVASFGQVPEKEKDPNCPPLFEFIIYHHKGRTFFETVYYIEDES